MQTSSRRAAGVASLRCVTAPARPGKGASLLRIVLVYAVALGAAVAWLALAPATGRLWLDALLADVVATLVVFGFSRAWRNSSCYDAYWSVAPPLLVTWWWAEGGLAGGDPRALLLSLVVWVWAIRLTGNWVYSWPGLVHEDWRYPILRERAGRAEVAADLFGIHVIPTGQVFLGLLGAYVALTVPGRDFGWLDAVAFLLGLSAVLLEFVADVQMHRFVARRSPGAVMDQGLWGWSRHPNYLGELLFWVSMALFGLSADPGAWWVLLGPAAMLAMFLGASIPMMEERSLARRPAYAEVVARVPMLLPRPPRRPAR